MGFPLNEGGVSIAAPPEEVYTPKDQPCRNSMQQPKAKGFGHQVGAVFSLEFFAQFAPVGLHRLESNFQVLSDLFRGLARGNLFQHLLFAPADPKVGSVKW
jgi:hypothetical protein